MARNKGTHFVITANRTEDGSAVYLDDTGGWVTALDRAHPLSHQSEVDQSLSAARAQERIVCDPYPMHVNLSDGVPVSLTERETIRNAGPTVPYRRPDSAKAAKEA